MVADHTTSRVAQLALLCDVGSVQLEHHVQIKVSQEGIKNPHPYSLTYISLFVSLKQ